MRAIHLYKFTACLLLILNTFLQLMQWSLFSFNLFPYFDNVIANSVFSVALAIMVIIINEKNYKFFPLFNILIFIDTILVYGNIQNFLVHVVFLVALTQMFYYSRVKKIEKTSVLKHLVDNE